MDYSPYSGRCQELSDMKTCIAHYSSPLGNLLLIGNNQALTHLRFTDEPVSLSSGNLPAAMEQTVCWLNIYFSRQQPDFLPPLHLQGTPFQQKVWQELLKIPYGKILTYGSLAQHVGCRSAQAVGQALHRNPIAIIVPCHRVVGAGGKLTGYAYGLHRKQSLLDLERL